MLVRETRARTFAKLLAYRGIIVFTTFAISLLFNATLNEAFLNALVSIPLGSLSYYFHERSWLLSSWFRNIGIDDKFRSLLKTVTYRILTGFLIFIVGKMIFIQSNATAAGYTLVMMINGVITFYIIERIFNRIEWGKIF